MKIRYIGKKATKSDTVAGTNTVWNGNGDIQEVLDTVAEKLLKHPDVWEVAPDVIAAPMTQTTKKRTAS
ncbi:MAG: hypothetical protein H7839_13525 [Magnetococcus sp. YQC-5]